MRLIDADAAKKKVIEEIVAYSPELTAVVVVAAMFDCEDDFPTVESEPVRHGEWAENKSDNGIFDYYFVCSECHKNTLGFLIAPDYCPNCGAKMDGGIPNETIHNKK